MPFFKKKGNDTEGKGEAIFEADLEDLKEKVKKANMPELVNDVALKEIEKLTKTSQSAAEYTIAVNYIDYLISLPWNKKTKDNLDIKRAETILEEEHYGLFEIKERILDYLAVRILKASRKHKVLVVDDEELVRRNLSHVLTKEGYEVITAANGAEALTCIDSQPIDVIVSDLKMDHIDGMGVLDAAKKKDPGIQVIMITGYATVPNAVDAIKKGSFHFITKPFKLDEIRSVVQEALRGKQLQMETKGPVLCFVGPPGTGKTSLGKSIARSLEKKFVRISLAGMKDEAEIRGHRRSYVGALPGRIVQEIRRVESNNPVFMLDEIDKIGQDFRGDPASALLEVLDPEQQANFIDHYLDVPFDLSSVMFIATANTTCPIPGPLLDRLEILTLSGYTEEEKEQIAFNYLIPRAIKDSGLEDAPPQVTPEAARMIIRDYTREAGLRNLQRQIDTIFRKIARQVLTSGKKKETVIVTPEMIQGQLGPKRFYIEVAEVKERIGVTTGLALTETGGEIIFVEANKMKGKGNLTLTGSLGDVMKESAQAALSYIRSHTEPYGIDENFFEAMDIHIHVPAGAIPKDGPSAGITIAMALISLLKGRPCRRDVAMTGELTLSGRILPVGGIREKILAARRAGVKTVVLPAKNDADIRVIPQQIQKDIKIIQIDELNEIVETILK